MKDFTGREIVQGDVVAIARRSGSSSWLARAVVKRTNSENEVVLKDLDNPRGREYQYKASTRGIMVVPQVAYPMAG